MKAEDIRSRSVRGDVGNFMLREIAAQFAEINYHLAKIANPLMAYDGPRWAWMTCNGKPFVVDAREVTGVASLDSGIGTDKPTVQIGMKGHPWSKAADGTVARVCAKLGIPVDKG